VDLSRNYNKLQRVSFQPLTQTTAQGVARILQREKKIIQTCIGLVLRYLRRLPLQRRIPAEKVSFSVFSENQIVRAAVAASQKREPFPAELGKKKRKTGNHH
jgi:hypothetical protein